MLRNHAEAFIGCLGTSIEYVACVPLAGVLWKIMSHDYLQMHFRKVENNKQIQSVSLAKLED